MDPGQTSRATAAYETRSVLTRLLGAVNLGWICLLVLLAAVMAALNPAYFHPMLSSIVGWLMILIAATVLGGGALMTLLAMRWMQRGGAYLGLGVGVILIVFLAQFVAMWIVLLGPALIIVMQG